MILCSWRLKLVGCYEVIIVCIGPDLLNCSSHTSYLNSVLHFCYDEYLKINIGWSSDFCCVFGMQAFGFVSSNLCVLCRRVIRRWKNPLLCWRMDGNLWRRGSQSWRGFSKSYRSHNFRLRTTLCYTRQFTTCASRNHLMIILNSFIITIKKSLIFTRKIRWGNTHLWPMFFFVSVHYFCIILCSL